MHLLSQFKCSLCNKSKDPSISLRAWRRGFRRLVPVVNSSEDNVEFEIDALPVGFYRERLSGALFFKLAAPLSLALDAHRVALLRRGL